VATAEAAAVAFGVAYILLAIFERRACWIAGGIGTAIYAAVFFDAGLPMQAALQLLYVVMSVYGWIAWRPSAEGQRPVRSWPLARHGAALAAIALATAVSAPLAARHALAAAPVADSLGAWASLFATWLLARRVIDTWIWWVAIDVGLAALFAGQGLWPTAGLYFAYALMAVAGWRSWRARRLAAA
jgi:nicotinamide mononucleotide transporter